MNIIFLDIDEVLNDRYNKVVNKGSVRNALPEQPIKIVQYVIEKTENTKIVFSTTWRKLYSITDLYERFADAGYTLPRSTMIGCTPSSSTGHRGNEIKAWLKGFERPGDKFVIIDDSTDFLPEQLPYFMRIHDSVGFTMAHAVAIVDYFNGDLKEIPEVSFTSRIEESDLVDGSRITETWYGKQFRFAPWVEQEEYGGRLK